MNISDKAKLKKKRDAYISGQYYNKNHDPLLYFYVGDDKKLYGVYEFSGTKEIELPEDMFLNLKPETDTEDTETKEE